MQAATAGDVQELIGRIYGDVDIASATGVIHVTAVWEEQPGVHITLRINDETPRSPWDFFLLNLARARADVIIATGKMLRDEPHLRFDLQGNAALGLADWRRSIVHKTTPPRLVLLTSGRGLTFDHPTFAADMPVTIATSPEAAGRIGPTVTRDNVDVGGFEATDIRSVAAKLRKEGAQTISIEAGPSTSAALYEDPAMVDELMLSTFIGQHIQDSVYGGPFRSRSELEALFAPTGPAYRTHEPSGPWQFERMARR